VVVPCLPTNCIVYTPNSLPSKHAGHSCTREGRGWELQQLDSGGQHRSVKNTSTGKSCSKCQETRPAQGLERQAGCHQWSMATMRLRWRSQSTMPSGQHTPRESWHCSLVNYGFFAHCTWKQAGINLQIGQAGANQLQAKTMQKAAQPALPAAHPHNYIAIRGIYGRGRPTA